MKSLAHKTGSVLLAFLLLFSTLSFSMDMHFCGKTLVDFELFRDAEGCGMSMDDSLMREMGCCSDVEIVVQGQEDLETPQNDAFQEKLQVVVAAVVELYPMLLHQDIRKALPPFKEYAPPRLVRDIPVCHQAFLI